MAKIDSELELDNDVSSNGGNGADGAKPGRKVAIKVVLAIALIIGLIIGVRYWQFVSTHATTEDAYVTSDVIQISPQVSGTVQEVFVSENQAVKKGQLLVALDDSTFRAAVDQARANLDVAIAQAKGAGVSVDLTRETGSAQITQAQGGLGQAESGIGGAKAAVAQAKAVLASSVANQKRAKAAVSSAQAAVSSATANLAAANAAVTAALANNENASREAKRFATLAKAGADSQEKADQSATTETSAKASLDVAAEQAHAAKAQLDARQADLDATREQVRAADASVEQSKALLAAAKEGVPQAIARQRQAQGQLVQAKTAPTQVAVSRTGKAQAEAKVEQARAALRTALLQLNYCRITAPVDGRVSKKTVEVGEYLQAGTPLMAVIPSVNMWVVANYKETQLDSLRLKNKAEVYVDAFPGEPFKGTVDSISAGTGSTFALLPPDNATGNFVKVVQRVPVKIVLDPDQPHLDELRAGMTVTAVVDKQR